MTEPIEDRLEAVAYDLYSNSSTGVLMHEAVEEIRTLRRRIAEQKEWLHGYRSGVEIRIDAFTTRIEQLEAEAEALRALIRHDG